MLVALEFHAERARHPSGPGSYPFQKWLSKSFNQTHQISNTQNHGFHTLAVLEMNSTNTVIPSATQNMLLSMASFSRFNQRASTCTLPRTFPRELEGPKGLKLAHELFFKPNHARPRVVIRTERMIGYTTVRKGQEGSQLKFCGLCFKEAPTTVSITDHL